MGGWQARTQSLTLKVKEDKDEVNSFMAGLTDEEIDAGFEFLGEAPCEPVKQSKWILKTQNKQTPVTGWPPAYIEKVLVKLAMEGCFAKKNFAFTLTMKDIQEWYLKKVIQKYWTQLKTKALIMLGEGGRGKTPIAEILALAVAEFWYELHNQDIPVPCYRITSDIDFLRGCTGVKSCTDIVDDADSNTLPIRRVICAPPHAQDCWFPDTWYIQAHVIYICDSCSYMYTDTYVEIERGIQICLGMVCSCEIVWLSLLKHSFHSL